MIDLNRSRRGYNFKCLYWKRDKNIDNDTLAHNSSPSGVFYAKIDSSTAKDKNDIAGVFRVDRESVVLKTQDILDIEEDDIVEFSEKLWKVGRVSETVIQKNAEYMRHLSKETTIELGR